MSFTSFSPVGSRNPRGARDNRLHSVCAALALGLFFATSDPARANDYYVAPTGSDTNPGTLEQPFATLQQGARVAMPGDTVYLRGGTYRVVKPDTTNAGIAITSE